MPIGKVNDDLNITGDTFKDGTPIIEPHEFGTPVTLPKDFGTDIPVSDPTLNSNPVNWQTPNPAHFGNIFPATLSIVNAGFESDILADNDSTNNSFADGWIGNDGGGGANSFGAWHIIQGAFVAPQGINVAYLVAPAVGTAYIQQTLVDTWLPSKNYTISFYTDSNAGSLGKVQLLSGATVVFDSGTLDVPFGTWGLKNLNFSASLATLGQPIIIRFLVSAGNEMEVDAVTLWHD